MGQNTTAAIVHPAYARLRDATRAERAALARALAIETDWRHHDGPELATRYWQAFHDVVADGDGAAATRALIRGDWQPLTAADAAQARDIFRALLLVMHPQVAPAASRDARAVLWPQVERAYRAGDVAALKRLLGETRRMRLIERLPEDVVALRAHHRHLRAARQAADRRLAELSQRFPFCLRDKLDDADWVRRQRLAWRQVRVLTATPRMPAARHRRKRVS